MKSKQCATANAFALSRDKLGNWESGMITHNIKELEELFNEMRKKRANRQRLEQVEKGTEEKASPLKNLIKEAQDEARKQKDSESTEPTDNKPPNPMLKNPDADSKGEEAEANNPESTDPATNKRTGPIPKTLDSDSSGEETKAKNKKHS